MNPGSVLTGGPARADDGRGSTAEAEIAAIYSYVHGPNPNQANVRDFQNSVAQDCRPGLVINSWFLWNGAHDRTRRVWASGVLYSMLNRKPSTAEIEDLDQYVGANGYGNGLMKVVVAGNEYRSRLDALCAGRRSTNGHVLEGTRTIETARQIVLADRALILACGPGR